MRQRAAYLLLAALAALALAGCSDANTGLAGSAVRVAGPIGAAGGPWREQSHWVRVTEAAGSVRLIHMRVCRSPGPAAKPLVLINHGKARSAAENALHRTASCDAEAVRWFLERDFVVALPQRRGYGLSGGVMAEAYGDCTPGRDYRAGASEAARDIAAALDYAVALPGVRRDSVVVVGQSAGGLGAIALSSRNDARVVGLVNMAGGDGGRVGNVANAVCQPAALVRAAGQFGAAARRPMLWLYTANDSYFAPPLATAMHQAYTAAGGQARLALLPAFAQDGHALFFGPGGSAVWGGPVERFLAPLVVRR